MAVSGATSSSNFSFSPAVIVIASDIAIGAVKLAFLKSAATVSLGAVEMGSKTLAFTSADCAAELTEPKTEVGATAGVDVGIVPV
jgi:hypothetical protein